MAILSIGLNSILVLFLDYQPLNNLINHIIIVNPHVTTSQFDLWIKCKVCETNKRFSNGQKL